MAKKKKGKKSGARKSSARGRSVGHPKFAGHTYDCHGKRVRTGKGKKTTPRVFCRRAA